MAALNFRNVLKLGRELVTYIPGVGPGIDTALDLVAPDKDKPSPMDVSDALNLAERLRALKPGANSAEFLAFVGCEGLLAKIVFDPSMPDGVRIAAAIALPLPAVGFMISRAWQKKKKDGKS